MVLLLLSGVLCTQCAQVKAPSGGAKDVTPPRLIEAVPPDSSINFSASSIELTFDEFIQLKNLQQQLLISPPMETPEVGIKKKSLVVELKDTLLPRTTYSINFGSAVADITEGNTTRNLKYVFSTGPYLDSLTVDGQVRFADDLSPAPNVYVMLYQSHGDSVPMKEKPYYFSKTGEEGEFRIGNLAGGRYKIFALKDDNFNYLFDLPEEAIAFQKELVTPVVKDSTLGLDLRMFREFHKRQYLAGSEVRKQGMLRLAFGLPAPEAGFELVGRQRLGYDTIREANRAGDTLTYWFKGVTAPDTFRIAPFAKDTLLDTLQVAFGPLKKKPREFEVLTNLKREHPPFQPPAFFSPYPVAKFRPEQITLVKDSDTVAVQWKPVDSTFHRYRMTNELVPGASYQLLAGRNAFTDLFGRTSDSLSRSFQTRELSEYGDIELKLNWEGDPGHPFVLQLLDKKGKTLRERTLENGGTIGFSRVLPGEYQLKLIFDRNANGQWDTGHYLSGRQPEQVVFYSGKIKVRSNWELSLDWTLDSL